MNLTREIAQQQAARLQACPMLCPQSAEGRRELVDTLLRHCADAEHCKRTMTALLDTAIHIQGALTAHMAALAAQTRDHGQAPPGCDRCDGGFDIEGRQKWAAHVLVPKYLPDRVVVEGFDRCDCPRGLWLRARDIERNARETAAIARGTGFQGKIDGLGRVTRPDARKLASGDDQ